MKAHLQAHSGLKPYKCTECPMSFITRGSLTRHATRHMTTRNFICPYCQKAFKANINCKKHISLHRAEFALQLMRQQQEQEQLEANSDVLNINSNEATSASVTQLVNQQSQQISLSQRVEASISEAIGITESQMQNSVVEVSRGGKTRTIEESLSYAIELPIQMGTQDRNYYSVQPSSLIVTTAATSVPLHASLDDTSLGVQLDSFEGGNDIINIDSSQGLVSDRRNHKCETCGMAFKKSSHLKQHMLR